eukprot:193211-Pleurochrysis_carterae.AAC.4
MEPYRSAVAHRHHGIIIWVDVYNSHQTTLHMNGMGVMEIRRKGAKKKKTYGIKHWGRMGIG